VDLIVESASDVIDTIIVVPPTIWGLGSGKVSVRSIQIPYLIKYALINKQAYQIGNGNNVWHHIHVEDLANLYILLLHLALEKKAPIGKEGYYLAENGEFKWGQIAQTVAKKMKELSIGDGSVKNATKEDYKKFFPDPQYDSSGLIGANSRGKSIKGKKLGWSPKYTDSDLFEYVAKETEDLSKQ